LAFNMMRVFKDVVRSFSLALHDPKGSHYKVLEVKSFQHSQNKSAPKSEARLDGLV
jgi:hypothetical protein